MSLREQARFGKVQLKGVRHGTTFASVEKVLIEDGKGDALLATGTSVPADHLHGYAKGCLFIDTDVAAKTGGLYCNLGDNGVGDTHDGCEFTLVTQGATVH